MPRAGSVVARLVVPLLVVLLATTAAPGVGGGTATATFADVGQIEPDTVLLDVSLDTDGDAAWAIRYRVRLDDDNASAAFESLEQDVSENRSAFTARFGERMEGTVLAAENATGRDMAVRNVSVRTTRQEIPQQYGVLVYEFEWTNFAATDGSTIRAGDAIGGLFLDESTSITIRWPAEYGVVSTDPAPDDAGEGSATWRGPRDFATDQPRVVLSTEAATGTTDAPAPGESSDGPSTTLLALVAVGALAVVAGAGLWWRSRGPKAPGPTAASDNDETPEELLSNEERVLRLLEAHGGRMKQQQVVEELGWTDAKTSQVVGALREAGEIEAFRLGRENVLDLPSEDEPGDDR